MLVEIRNLSKKYGHHEALHNINLDIKAGEIHGLIGENGAGKTTLLKILLGSIDINESGGYTGTVRIDGELVASNTPADSIRAGIGMVHQEFALISNLSVAENIKFGRENLHTFLPLFSENLLPINRAKDIYESARVLDRIGVSLNPRWPVLNLPLSLKQFVELARELDRGDLRLLLMDEPTATLGEKESKQVADATRELADRGIAVLFISHRLEEVLSICDRISVLRNGKLVNTYVRDKVSAKQLAVDMIGREARGLRVRKMRKGNDAVQIEFQDFSVDMPGETLKKLNLKVYSGEIMGVASLSGQGKTALGNGALGLYPSRGKIIINGQNLNNQNTKEVMRRGAVLLPEERRETGLLMHHTIADNIIFPVVQLKKDFLRKYWPAFLAPIDRKKADSHCSNMVDKLDIRCRDIEQKVQELSGGNQQKVCLARALSLKPKVLFVNEPTRGVDIGSKQRILESLLQINEELGSTIICASSEINELKSICDRILVLYEGQQQCILPPTAPDADFALALGGKWDENPIS